MQNRATSTCTGCNIFQRRVHFLSRLALRRPTLRTEGVGRVRGAAGVKINSRGRRFTAQGAAQRARQCVCCIRGCERVHVVLLLPSSLLWAVRVSDCVRGQGHCRQRRDLKVSQRNAASSAAQRPRARPPPSRGVHGFRAWASRDFIDRLNSQPHSALGALFSLLLCPIRRAKRKIDSKGVIAAYSDVFQLLIVRRWQFTDCFIFAVKICVESWDNKFSHPYALYLGCFW